jgi:PAS domain S-box-containing protein/excisionase family DNA binding protein
MSELMTTKEASEYLKLSYMTLYKLAQQGEIPAYKLGGHWRFNRTVLDDWFANKSKVMERNILIIGDDLDTLEINNLITNREDFKVTTVKNPERAYKELELAKYSIIFPISKPAAITNAEIISEIRLRDNKATIVISTKPGDEPIALDALSAGPLFIIQKPFQENDILKILHSLDSQVISQEAKAKDQLMSELLELRQRIDHLAAADDGRKKTEESLYQAEEKLRRFMESSNDIFILLDAKFNVVEINKAATRYLPAGTERKDYIGKNILTLMPSIKESSRYQRYLEVLNTGKPLELNDVTVDPAFGDLRVSARVFKVGNGLGIMATDITELKLLESLKESEEFSSSLLDNAPYPILVAEANTAIKYVNPALLKLTGYSLSELIGKKVPYPYWTEEATHRMIKHTEEVLLDSVQKLELPMKKKNGKLFWIEVTTKTIMKNDKLSCYLSIWVDITKRKKADEELLQEKDFSEATINSLPGVFYLIDTKGNFVKWNKNLEIETEYSAEEISKMNPLNLFSKKDRPFIQKKIDKVFAEGHDTAEVNAISKSGRVVPYYLTGSRIILNNNTYLAGVGIEISERKRMEEEVRESEERLKTFIENAPDAIFIHDTEGKIIDLNRKAEKLLEVDRKDYIGKSVLDTGLIDKKYIPKVISGLEKSKKGEASEAVEIELITKKGNHIVVEATGFPVTRKGKIEVFDIVRDITKLKRGHKAPVKKIKK